MSAPEKAHRTLTRLVAAGSWVAAIVVSLCARPTPIAAYEGQPCTALNAACAYPAEVCNVSSSPGATGYCIRRPTSCGENYEPVCGGDGISYRNDCVRLRAGITFTSFGTCVPGGCRAGDALCLPTEVCNVTADPGATGYCHPYPTSCGDNYEPVCGGDGVTYRNDCVRLQARATFRQAGPCPVRSCTAVSGNCTANEVCNVTAEPGAVGACTPRPPVCGSDYNPVCGGNDVTYPNDCARLQAGVTFKQAGPCPTRGCGPFPGGECGAGEVCNIGAQPGCRGTCIPRPTSCPATYQPVCGPGGQTYLNDCYRLYYGAALVKLGPC